MHNRVTKQDLGRHLGKKQNLKQTIMKTLNVNTGSQNKRKTLFVNFTNTKRIQWDRYRRYGMFTA